MRVLHVIPSIGPLRGGPSIAMGIMARALRAAGVAVDVATTNDNARQLLNVPVGIPIDEQGVRYWYFERTAYPYTTSARLARWLRNRVADYDVVHAHALFSFSTSAAAAAARRVGKPYIIRPLGTLAEYGMRQHFWLKRVSWFMVERRLLRHAAAVHFTSEAERAEAARLGNWRGVVVPLGVENIDIAPRPDDTNNELRLLFLSRIHPKKRVDLLLRAFALALQTAPNLRLIIAGSGDTGYLHEMHKLAADLGVTERVQWAGHVTAADKTSLLQRAHAFVLPSVNENFGIAAVEALAAGLPVVLTRGVAIHREVEAHRAGFIVEPDPASLTTAFLSLRDTDTRAQLSTNARTLARTTFSIPAMQQGLLRMYEQVLAA